MGTRLILAALVSTLASAALAQTETVTYQGRLTDAGGPANGSFDLTFRIFAAPTGGVALFQEAIPGVAVSGGLFTVILGQTTSLQGLFDGQPRWLEIEVQGTPLAPRQELTSSPGALYSVAAASALDFTGTLAGEVGGTQAATVVSNAVSTNTPDAVVRRDGAGDFAAGTITADLAGNAATATSATSFTGDLAGEVTGTQTATVVSNAVSTNTPGAVVRRDGAGDFAAGTITADLAGNAATATSATSFTGDLAGEVTGTQGATAVSNAVSANTASAIVRRDGTGDFSAGTVTLSGNLDLPNTASGTVGVLTKSGTRFLHNFGNNNTFLGASAGNTTVAGGFNVAVGNSALGANVGGTSNTALGSFALAANLGGNFNVAIGRAALSGNLNGFSNVAVGRNALLSLDGGTSNVAIGAGAGGGNSTGSNNIYISHVGLNESGAIRIGDPATHTATFIAGISGATVAGGVGVVVDANGHLGTIVSSRRYKRDIADLGDESEVLMRLRPVSFYYRPDLDADHIRQYGLVAEEVAGVDPGLVAYGADGAPETVRYHFVNALLLGEVQRQRRLIDEQRATMAREHAEMEELKARLARIEARLATVP